QDERKKQVPPVPAAPGHETCGDRVVLEKKERSPSPSPVLSSSSSSESNSSDEDMESKKEPKKKKATASGESGPKAPQQEKEDSSRSMKPPQDPHVKLQWIHPDEVDTLPMDEDPDIKPADQDLASANKTTSH
ncbi:unnamed protein product, partial [Durusdinium trenchii]